MPVVKILTFLELDKKFSFSFRHNIVPDRKWPFLPISASTQNFNPCEYSCMPVVKILIFPDIDSDLDKKFSFSFRH